MTRAFHGQLLAVVALVAVDGRGLRRRTRPAVPQPSDHARTPCHLHRDRDLDATATASPPPSASPTTAPSPRATATATPSPSPTPPAPATAQPQPPLLPSPPEPRPSGTTPTTPPARCRHRAATSSSPTPTTRRRSSPPTKPCATAPPPPSSSTRPTPTAPRAPMSTTRWRPGDLFEWYEADDCFVRYTVTEVKPDPTGDRPPQAPRRRVDDLRLHGLQRHDSREYGRDRRLGGVVGPRWNEPGRARDSRHVPDCTRGLGRRGQVATPDPTGR